MNVFKNLFKEVSLRREIRDLCGDLFRHGFLTSSQAGTKDVITLFHSPKSPASMRVHALLKQTAATAHSHATEDQASDHSTQDKAERTDFTLGR